MNEFDIKAIERVQSLLEFIKLDGTHILKIISIVQDNPKYFDAKLGTSCLETAANKLSELVKQNS